MRISLLGILVFFSAAAMAEGAAPATPAPGAASDSVTLEKVEVTAQRRVERLQDVPVAVTAVTRDQIETRRVQDIGDLDGIAPGLQISKTPSNTTISQITIRGISQINPAIYWDPAVGIYLDGVYIGKAQGSIFDIVDLTRVEVLRGPQGTLYGRNTMGGTINLWSREPSGAFSGSASLEFGNYNAMVEKVNVDLPRIGIASVAIGARSERRDGWIDTTSDSSVPQLNNRHNDGVRVAVHFDFLSNFTGDYKFDHSNVDQTNNFDQLYRADPGFFTFVGFPDLPTFVSTDRQKAADVDSPSFERSKVTGHSLSLAWVLNNGDTIKSITGWRQLQWDDSLDLDGSPRPVAFTQRFTDYDQTSQDLQYIGSADRWNYVAGVYYFGDDGRTNNPQHFFGGAADFDSRYATKTSAISGYTQIDYRILDPLTIAAGVRYTHEKKQLDRVFGARGSPNDPFFYFIPEGTHAEGTFHATTPMASIRYEPNKRLNLYARYAEGFKSGGFNGEFSDTTLTPQQNVDETKTPFRPERQKTIELGSKATLANGKALINVAVFQSKATDLQESIFTATGAASSTIRNAGKATIRGAELELALIPMEGTTLRANYAYLHSKYDEFKNTVGGVEVNEADNRAFVHAPKNAFNLVADSRFYKMSWGTLRGTIDYVWTDSFFTYPYNLQGDPTTTQLAGDTEVRAHGVLNLRLAAVDMPLGNVGWGELSIWCRNALDDDTANNFIDFGPAFGHLTVANFEEPRTFGVTGTVRW